MQKNKKEIFSKKKLVQIDHLTAWIAVPMLMVSTIVYYCPAPPRWTGVFNLAFQVLFLIHALISIYRFRLPELKVNKKSLQVYSGYGILITVILNMVFYRQAMIAELVFWINWVFVGLHVFISLLFRFQLQQKRKKLKKAVL